MTARSRPMLGSWRRRLTLVFGVMAAVVLAFVVRLVFVQIVDAPALDAEAEGKRSVPITLKAVRGSIVDRSGNVLAQTTQRYRLVVDQTIVGDAAVHTDDGVETWTLDQIVARIAEITGRDEARVSAALTGTSRYSVVADGLDADQYTRLSDLEVSWFVLETEAHRTYPSGAVAGNLLGFVGSDENAQAGIELMEDSCLSGTDGEQTYERSADGVRIPGTTVTEQPVVDGGTVTTTIDRDLQWYVQQKITERQKELGSQWIAVTVLDAKTGDILVAAETPSVDPNDVSASKEQDRGSRIFQSTYEPGSPVKSITMAAAIEHGGVGPETQYTIGPSAQVPGTSHVIKDAWEHGTLRLTSTGILMDSSNIGIMQVGDTIDDATRYEYLERFGIGQKTAVGFPAESAGILADSSDWDAISHYTTMFGQGIAATPIQIASAYQAIANDGVRISPRLVKSCTAADGTVTETPQAEGVQVMSSETARTLRGMLVPLFTEHTGTTAQIAGYSLAGKTGTSQIAGTNGGYLDDQYVTSLFGMAPAGDPRYVVGITIYNPSTEKTSSNTMSLFHDVMAQTLITNDVTPATGELPAYKTSW
ncbi:peptidoglycan D,D-transpeptidase FtsI family protein [Pseudoclavibacter caeni]|jgi:cell division protein FtsI (penicillin-binding protein 3)|uniref:Penicillin-binding protein 2 n=1 Tax=Pseudoclavibacter caeni TaxID=908846 RepID=A0A7C8FJ63_9MICO|nr:penicillin-binding protein 2 [Pseudoclavibacter caeni]KAB1632986.1 penicillin-binding protein 2 [Pseudoclavibacter caeni]NYJ97038.1 cell division protein FtsI (penicillin-binding protein 3) [Pseudoclavibacter caeni]